MKKGILFFIAFLISCFQLYAQSSTQLQINTHGDFGNKLNNYIGTKFTRNIDIFNVQNAPFTGYIKIIDHSGSALGVKMKITPSPKITLISPSSASSIFTAVGYQLTPAIDNEIVLRVNNFIKISDLIIVQEDVEVLSCLNSGNTSRFEVSLVETTSLTPPLATDYIAISGSTYDQIITKGETPLSIVSDYAPSYIIRPSYPFTPPLLVRDQFYCTGNENFKHMQFSLGLSDAPNLSGASFHNFKLIVRNQSNTLFAIDRLSITIEKRTNASPSQLVQSWNVTDQYDKLERTNDPTSDACLSLDQKFDELKYNLGELGPNEHYVIAYDLYNCCKKADLFDNKMIQSNNYLFYTFEDDCGNFFDMSGERALGPNTAKFGGLNNGIIIESAVFSSPSTILGPSDTKAYTDLANFVIDNPLDNNNYYGFFNGEGTVFDELQAEVVIRVKSGASLRYVTSATSPTHGSYNFLTNPGQFSYYPSIGFLDKNVSGRIWNPVDPLGNVVSTSPAGYETREFRFKLTDMPGLINSTDRAEIFEAFFVNMNSMQLTYTMEGICSAEDDGSWEVQYFFKTCNTACIIPITKVADAVVVTCPGCKVPGAAVSSGTAERTFYGAIDPDNDNIFANGQTESTINTLSTILQYNRSNSDPSDDIQTAIGVVNDDITFQSKFYLTVPSDCISAGRISCRDNELQYEWAYLQVKVPKGYFDPTVRNLTIGFERGGITSSATAHTVSYYTGGTMDIYYIKIKSSDLGHPYFLSQDAFHISFNSKIILNVAQRERKEIQYRAYFTQTEETLATLQIINANLENRSYADCTTPELRGMRPNCNTGDLQMICESWGSYMTFVSINTVLRGTDYSGYTQNKSCLKYAKANSTAYYPGEKSNFGNPTGFSGLNLFKNEFRRAPLIQSMNIVVPEGYYFNSISILSSYGNGSNKQESFFIRPTDADFGATNLALNNAVNTNRVLTFDTQILSKYSIADGTPNPDKPLHYADESFQPEIFNITLIPDCKYLADHLPAPITETDLGNVVINGNKIYSTATFDNPFIGTNGTFVIGGDGAITRSPLYNTAINKFNVIKLNAEGQDFRLVKNTHFTNEFDIRQNYNTPTPADDYDGNVFFGVNLAQIKQYFSEFKVEVSGFGDTRVVIDISETSAIAAGVYNDARPMHVKVTGVINLTSISTCSDELKTAIYDLIYGIHCKTTDILTTSLINGITTTTLAPGLCNQWTERITLKIDNVDMLLTTNVDNGYPQLSANTITHQAIFTATRSEITQLDVQLTNTPASTTIIKSVSMVKNTQSSTTSIPLVVGINYTFNASTNLLRINQFPAGVFFETINELDDYYNEIHVVFDVVNTNCAVDKVQTTIQGTATPFYSATQCKTVRSQLVEAPLTNPSKPVVSISGETIWCIREPLTLTATPSPAQPSSTTYTWYKIVNGSRQLLSGPSVSNTYTYNDLLEATTFEVELRTAEGCIATNTHHVTLLPADQCCTYKLGDITLNCSTGTQNICVPLVAVRNVPAGIIGMDFCLKYDPTVMRYTGPTGSTTSSTLGTVVTNGGLYGASYATYKEVLNGVETGVLRVSIYYTGTGVNLASFKGFGEVICLNFSVPPSAARQGIYPITMCTVNDLQEAYTLEEKAACWKPGSLTIQVPDIAKGRLQNPLYGNSIWGRAYTYSYANTTITAVAADCDPQNLLPATTIVGTGFSVPVNGAAKIKLKREVHGNLTIPRMQYQLFVNGTDTWKIHRITTMDPVLNSNTTTNPQFSLFWYSMTAADVNMNGHVRSNDISLIQERVVGKRNEFPQVWNNNQGILSLDWRFVDQTTVLANASFRKSTAYPSSDGQGFYRENTPNIPLCLDVRKNCDGQIPELYYGVMLGDVYPTNSANAPGTNNYLRTSGDSSSITVDAKHAQYLGNNIYRVPVVHKYAYEYTDKLFAIDLYMDYNQQKIRVNNVLHTTVTTDGGVSMMWNNADEDVFILTSYATLDSIAGTGVSYYLDIEKYTDEPFRKVDFGTLQFLLNGELVEARVETGETTTGTTDGQSSIEPHISVIPNPASGAATIDFAVSNNSNENRIIITDVLGRTVKSFEHVQNFGMVDFNTEDLAAGMYIITLKGENGFGLSEKFQVRK